MALFEGIVDQKQVNKMDIDTKYITKENSKKLLNEVLLSIKSNNDIGLSNNSIFKSKSDKDVHEIGTYSIRTKTNNDNSLKSFSLSIKKWKESKWFRTVSCFSIKIKTESKNYGSNYDIELFDNQDIIREIYEHLINLEENRKKEEINKKLSSIINDISTTVDKSHRRDETINEILN